jgi:hypothetical protein
MEKEFHTPQKTSVTHRKATEKQQKKKEKELDRK